MSDRVRCIGLKDSTAEEIAKLIKYHRDCGCRVTHITHSAKGKKLPFNGILNVRG